MTNRLTGVSRSLRDASARLGMLETEGTKVDMESWIDWETPSLTGDFE
jgi:hypothetical protein